MTAPFTVFLSPEQLAHLVGTKLSPDDQVSFLENLGSAMAARPWYIENEVALNGVTRLCKGLGKNIEQAVQKARH